MALLRRYATALSCQWMKYCAQSPHQIVLINSNRLYSSDVSNRIFAQQLDRRGVVQLSGRDTSVFLQGLITNDMNCLKSHECGSLYSLVLNPQGRVLYDLIIYQCGKSQERLFIECDKNVTGEMISHLRRYKLRRKVDLVDVSDTHKLWAFFRPAEAAATPNPDLNLGLRDTDSFSICTADPRMKSFGWRCLAPSTASVTDIASNIIPTPEGISYESERFKLGIGEGIVDLPSGKCLPLECNLVYLHGVSFDKGCYVGQELTARTYHTGVTRKRLMPLTLSSDSCDIPPGANIEKTSGKSAGVLRSTHGRYALGVVRLSDLKAELSVMATNGEKVGVQIHQPSWWSAKESKEKSQHVEAASHSL